MIVAITFYNWLNVLSIELDQRKLVMASLLNQEIHNAKDKQKEIDK